MVNLNRISKDKLLAAGYKFLRADDNGGGNSAKPEPKIKVSEHFGAWYTHSLYGTKKERDAAMRQMVEEAGSKYIVID